MSCLPANLCLREYHVRLNTSLEEVVVLSRVVLGGIYPLSDWNSLQHYTLPYAGSQLKSTTLWRWRSRSPFLTS